MHWSVVLDADVLDGDLVPGLLLVDIECEGVGLLESLGDGGLVEVKVKVLEPAACVQEHVPLLVSCDACYLKCLKCLCCDKISVDGVPEVEVVRFVVFDVAAAVGDHRFDVTGGWRGWGAGLLGWSSVLHYCCLQL